MRYDDDDDDDDRVALGIMGYVVVWCGCKLDIWTWVSLDENCLLIMHRRSQMSITLNAKSDLPCRPC